MHLQTNGLTCYLSFQALRLHWQTTILVSMCCCARRPREALGNKREQSSSRPYLFGLNGFDADRRLFSLFPPVFRLNRASMGCCMVQLGTPIL